MHSPNPNNRIKPGEVLCKICHDEIRGDFILNVLEYGNCDQSGDYRMVKLEHLCNPELPWVHFDCYVDTNEISEENAGDLKVVHSIDFCDSCGYSFGQNDGYSCQSCEIFSPRFCPECSCLETLGIRVFLCGDCHHDVESGDKPFVIESDNGKVTKLTFSE